MKIAYFGSDMFYGCMEMLLQNGHEIIALFTPPPKDGEYDFSQNIRRQAEILSIPAILSKPTSKDIAVLAQEGCEMILSAGCAHKIPPWKTGSIRYGANIHPSLLPEGGGPVPMPFVITKGLKKTGVTLQMLSQRWDAGDIILQAEIPLLGDENLETVLLTSQKAAVDLLQRFLESPEKHWSNAASQCPKDGDYWPMPHPDALLIPYTESPENTARYLRAHRFVHADGNIEFMSGISFWEEVHDHEPGATLSKEGSVYLVATKGGVVRFKLESKPSPECNFFTSETLPRNKLGQKIN